MSTTFHCRAENKSRLILFVNLHIWCLIVWEMARVSLQLTVISTAFLGLCRSLQLVEKFSDNFDANWPNRGVDPSKWTVLTGPGKVSNEMSTFSAEDVWQENNHLLLRANFVADSGTATPAVQYYSGGIHTAGKFSVQYGEIEWKAKLPSGKGFYAGISWNWGTNKVLSIFFLFSFNKWYHHRSNRRLQVIQSINQSMTYYWFFIDSTNQASNQSINLSAPWHFKYTQSINQSIKNACRVQKCDTFSVHVRFVIYCGCSYYWIHFPGLSLIPDGCPPTGPCLADTGVMGDCRKSRVDALQYRGDISNRTSWMVTYGGEDFLHELRHEGSEVYRAEGFADGDNYHLFKVLWDDQQVAFYVDGVAKQTITNPAAHPHCPMYLMMHTAVGGWYAGQPDTTALAATFSAHLVLDEVSVKRWE